MVSPELVVKKSSNDEVYTFKFETNGQPRNVTGDVVKLYIIGRYSRQIMLTATLDQVAGIGNEHKKTWTTDKDTLPPVGFYDGETHITDGTVDGYDEPYDEFPVTIEESATDNPADKTFENWLSSP